MLGLTSKPDSKAGHKPTEHLSRTIPPTDVSSKIYASTGHSACSQCKLLTTWDKRTETPVIHVDSSSHWQTESRGLSYVCRKWRRKHRWGNYPGVRCQEGIICLVPGLSHVINGTLPSYQSIKGQSGGHLRTPAAFRSFPAETPAAHNSLCWGRRRLLEMATMLLGKVMRSGAMR